MAALTPYLASALRLGGPSCERAFLALEERSLLRGAPVGDERIKEVGPAGLDDPDPFPLATVRRRKAA